MADCSVKNFTLYFVQSQMDRKKLCLTGNVNRTQRGKTAVTMDTRSSTLVQVTPESWCGTWATNM